MKSTTLAWAIRTALIASACVQTSGFASEAPASTDVAAATSDAQPKADNKDDKTTNLETVTVTGIVGSLNKSIDAKRSETAIVDAVSAEDVGKFPDNNIAESLQRITGVEITRDANGEGQYVTIRGLPTDFTYFTLNGLPVSSVTGQGSRSFDFSVLSSDFISTLKVYKSSRADLDEGGIAGNVDVETITPFGIGKERAVLSAKMQGNPGGYNNRNYPDVSGIYSNIFADGTLGLTVGFDWNKRFYLNENSTATAGWEFIPYCFNPTDPSNANGSCAGGTKATVSQYAQLQNAGTKLDTKTGYLSAQWKPFDSTVVTLDGMYVHRTSDLRASTLILVPSYPWGTFTINGPVPANLPTDANGLVTRWYTPYTWTDARSDYEDKVGQTKNVSLNVDTKLSNWEFSGTAQYSKTATHEQDVYAQGGWGPGLGNLPNYSAGYQMSSNGGPQQILLPPGGLPSSTFGSDEITPFFYRGGDEIKLLKADITRTFDDSPIQDIKFGGKVYRRELPYYNHAWYYNNLASTNSGTPFSTAFMPNPFGNLLESSGGIGVNNLPFINYQQWLNQYFGGSFANEFKSPNVTDYGVTQSDIVERGRSAYVMADFRFDNGSIPIYGNVGVRYQTTTTQIFYNGYTLNDPSLVFDPNCANNDPTCTRFKAPTTTYTSQSGKNHAVLPSLNVAADLRDDMVLRFSTSKTMSRPTLGNMNPAVSFDYTFFAISSGNPNLAPFKSTNYDLSYEWYFRPTSVLSVAVYDKEMTGFIQQITEPYSFRGTPFRYTTYVNGSDAYVRGFEVDYKQVFDFLPGFWSGFGTEFNFTYSKGQQSAFNVAAQGDIPAISKPASPFLGLTPRTTNLSVFYEKYGLSASIAVNRRGQYLVGTDSIGGTVPMFNYVNSRTLVDLHAAYSINEHFKVFGDVTNLTDKPITGVVTANGVNYPGAWQYNGRRVDIGATYSF